LAEHQEVLDMIGFELTPEQKALQERARTILKRGDPARGKPSTIGMEPFPWM